MLAAYNDVNERGLHVLKASTIRSQLWQPQSDMAADKAPSKGVDLERLKTAYGLGWVTAHDKHTNQLEHVYHTGGAVGASSCLLVVPGERLVVAVLCNSQSVGEIVKFTQRVARLFATNNSDG